MDRIRLLCLPHAGASALYYARWQRKLPSFIEVQPLELPGRGARATEPFARTVSELAEALCEAWESELRGARFAIFGHSLGAVVGFELAHALRGAGLAASALFVSASRAPRLRRTCAPQPLDDFSLLESMRALDVVPAAMLRDPAFLSLALPVLRADYALANGYVPRERPPLPCALHVLGGVDDDISQQELMAWRGESAGAFTLNVFEGGHFYLRGAESQLLSCLTRHLLAPHDALGALTPRL